MAKCTIVPYRYKYKTTKVEKVEKYKNLLKKITGLCID